MKTLRLRYQTIEFGEKDIHLCTLRDNQQFHDPSGKAERLGISSACWPIFGVVWPSSLALAHFMNSYDTANKRVLEVGCGIGLPSILLNTKHVDITATDHHPEVGLFLNRNTQLNGDADIAYERTDWADGDDTLGLFDIIIGSDLLYEEQHVRQLAQFIDQHSSENCEVILVDPGRGRKSKLAAAMTTLGYSHTYQQLPHSLSKIKPVFKGYILKFLRTALPDNQGAPVQ